MSRNTPRKSRHRRHPSSAAGAGLIPAASDYESDARDLPPPPSHPPHRTNTELNLSVLRRYLPDVSSILSIAANAVVYTFSPAAGGWEKAGVEGTLFVCRQDPPLPASQDATQQPEPPLRVCVFVLNRRGLDNFAIELRDASACEVSGELIMFNVVNSRAMVSYGQDGVDRGDGEGEGGSGQQDGRESRVFGIWIHADRDDTRDVNIAVIQAAWQQIRQEEESRAGSNGQEDGAPATTGGEAGSGRRLSITDLFGQKNGTRPS